MIERKRGRIVNMLGGGLWGPFEYGTAYGSSKAAVAKYTESLSCELEEHGLYAFSLDPGLVDTTMPRNVVESAEGSSGLSG